MKSMLICSNGTVTSSTRLYVLQGPNELMPEVIPLFSVALPLVSLLQLVRGVAFSSDWDA